MDDRVRFQRLHRVRQMLNEFRQVYFERIRE
jgi:hypothetical protein